MADYGRHSNELSSPPQIDHEAFGSMSLGISTSPPPEDGTSLVPPTNGSGGEVLEPSPMQPEPEMPTEVQDVLASDV